MKKSHTSLPGTSDPLAHDFSPVKASDHPTSVENEYAILLQTSLDGFWVHDSTGRLLDCNPAICQMLGYSREELLKMTLMEINASRSPEEIIAQIRKTAQYGSACFQTQHRRKDGAINDVEVSVRYIAHLGDRYYSFIRDITERKKIETALTLEKTFNDALLNSVPGMIYLYDIDGNLVRWNQKLGQITGYSPEELAQKNLLDWYGNDKNSQKAIAAGVEAALRDGFGDAEANLRTKDGRIIPIYFTASRLTLRGRQYFAGLGIDISDRRQAEETIRGVQNRANALIENAPDGIMLIGLDGSFQFASPSARRILGFGADEALPDNPAELTHPDDLALVMETLSHVIQDPSQIPTLQYRFRNKGGGWLWLESAFTNLLADPNVGAIVNNFRDITVRKEAQIALQESQRRLFTLMSNLPGLAYRSQNDPKWTMEFISEGCYALTGYPSQELLNNAKISYAHLIHPEDRLMVWRETQARLEQKQPYQYDYRIRTASGEEKWVWEQGQGVFGSDGRLEGLEGFILDITQEKQAEEALRISEKKYQVLTEISPVGIFQADMTGSVIYFNPKWSEISGMPAQEAMGDGWLQAILPEDRPRISRDWKKAIHSQNPSNGEYRFAHKDGSVIWAFFQAIPEKDEAGRIISFVGTVTDINDRKRAQEQTETQIHRLGALHEIDTAITASFDLQLILNVLLEHTTSQLGMHAASVFLLNPVSQALDYAAGSGFRTHGHLDSTINLEDTLAGRIVKERRPLHINIPSSIQHSLKFDLFLKEEGFVAYCGVPLIAKGEIIGVLEVYNRLPFKIDTEWMAFLMTLAEQAAIAIDNAQLFKNLQRINQELSRAYDATIEGWSHALDLRDKETEGHTLRVTQMTEHLARAMGMSEAELVQIRRGALLHDIGKLGVPDSILLKPEQLTQDEWVIMKKHPQFAYDMLAPISYLRQALDIPYHHHEKWDGSGYPNGLKGEEIPLAARLFAVVDVWDALLSDRPYRLGWPKDVVINYIQSKSGTQFDPEVVKLFIDGIHKQESESSSH